ncbi:hypothetical protein BD413DRAFT_523541 [Trametes elegans]|nr:hypothetical protein BD413DRAFT_523541 [Trametes elegans]
MPGLIQRYNAVAEYSEFITTNPSSTQRRRTRHTTSPNGPSSARAALSSEAAEWYEAVCPPLEEIQDVLRRFRADPEFSQERVFAFCAPIVVFGALFIVAVVAVQPHSFAHRILDAPGAHTRDIATFASILVGGVVLSLVVLKCAIWGIAEISSVVMGMETREERERRESEGIPSSNMVLGGFFT